MELTLDQLQDFGRRLGDRLRGGECIELIGDVGAGKTTLVKAMAQGLAIDEDVQSPSFTISRQYEARDGLRLAHYDFYRLAEPGIMAYEINESLDDKVTITVVEWAETVRSVLPENRVQLWLDYVSDQSLRSIRLQVPAKYDYLELT